MSFTIAGREVGPGTQPYVILEAGINHNGDLELARQMIRAAKAAGADAIKFQTFKAEEFVASSNQMFTYKSQGVEVTESMLEMFQRVEFSPNEWRQVKSMCEDGGILFLSTPQNVSDMEFLVEDLDVPALKVGSDDFTNLPLLQRYAQTGLPLILSCGMADLGEVHDALAQTEALETGQVLLMLCTSQYPTPPTDANILKLNTLAGAFPGLPLGFSDHTQGPTAAVLALACGAVAFEKHFTLSHDLPGPDHWFSETPQSGADWVSAIRTAHLQLGSGRMVPTKAEVEMRVLARRSLTALRDIPEGAPFDDENTGSMRPGDGLPPKHLPDFLGKTARHGILRGHQLDFGDIS